MTGKFNIDKFEELAGVFSFHLSDTHGIPLEIIKEKFLRMNYWNLICIIYRHKDFKKSQGIKLEVKK